jgi:hypothetical protein
MLGQHPSPQLAVGLGRDDVQIQLQFPRVPGKHRDAAVQFVDGPASLACRAQHSRRCDHVAVQVAAHQRHSPARSGQPGAGRQEYTARDRAQPIGTRVQRRRRRARRRSPDRAWQDGQRTVRAGRGDACPHGAA